MFRSGRLGLSSNAMVSENGPFVVGETVHKLQLTAFAYLLVLIASIKTVGDSVAERVLWHALA